MRTHRSFFNNGSIRCVIPLNSENKVNGIVLRYFSSGKLDMETMYENEVKHGKCNSYDENSGVLYTESLYNNGKLVSKKYYFSSGKIKSIINYKNNKKHGYLLRYHRNGQLESETYYFDDVRKGPVRCYDRKGNLSGKFYY